MAAMGWPRLDTRWWNLSVGVAATSVAACGPAITLDGEAESVGTTEGETDTSTENPPTTTSPTPECQTANDCEPGWECIDNVCEPYDYCADGDCCYDGCCYDGCYYYECYSHLDCGESGLCDNADYVDYGGNCSFVEPVPQCADPPQLLAIPIEEGGLDEIISLSFVDANGDSADDLVVSRASGATTLYPGASAGDPSPLAFPKGLPPLAVRSGDFNDDGFSDLVGNLSDGQIIILTGGDLGFTLTAAFPEAGIVDDLQVLDWDGDGALDLAGIGAEGQALVALGDGAAGLAASFVLETGVVNTAMLGGTFGPDAFDDLVVHEPVQTFLFYGNAVGDAQPDVALYPVFLGPNGVLAADFDGGGLTDVVRYTPISEAGWILLDTSRDGGGPQSRQALLGTNDPRDSDAGDVNGDGIADAVLADELMLTVLLGNLVGGNAPMFACRFPIEYPYPTPTSALAVGDFDGNGRADIVVADIYDVVALMSP